MNNNDTLTATASIHIQKPLPVVWNALIDPNMIREYLFGTETETDWKPGSPITFRGSWQGKTYEDKGVVLDFQEQKFLRYTYWSSMSGTPDLPENYANVSFSLFPEEGSVKVVIQQDHCMSEESRLHSENNWKTVLQTMKEKVEQA